MGLPTKNDERPNLVHIAHNVQVGKGVCIIGGASISGSTRIGDHSYLAPGTITRNGISIGKNSFVALGATLRNDMDDDQMYFEQIAGRMLKTKDYRRLL